MIFPTHCFQAFRICECDNRFAKAPKPRAREPLRGHDFDEIRRAQSAAQTRHVARGQDVIGSGSIIARRDRAIVAQEDRSSRFNAIEMLCGIFEQGQVLGRKAVHKRNRFLKIARDDDRALTSKRLFGDRKAEARKDFRRRACDALRKLA